MEQGALSAPELIHFDVKLLDFALKLPGKPITLHASVRERIYNVSYTPPLAVIRRALIRMDGVIKMVLPKTQGEKMAKWKKSADGRKKLLVWGFVLALFFTSCASSLKGNYLGRTNNINVLSAKDFQSVGLIFVETEVHFGNGEKITYDALLKEAAKKGADTVVNVMIDVKKEGWRFLLFTFNAKETWYGSALAIKYTEALKQVTVTEGKTVEGAITTSDRSGLTTAIIP